MFVQHNLRIDQSHLLNLPNYQQYNHGNLIWLAYSNYNNINDNILENTNNRAIYLAANSDYNIIAYNNFSNVENGIMLRDGNCDYNNITGNICKSSEVVQK